MTKLISNILFVVVTLASSSAFAEKMTIAAAADLKYAMDEIVQSFMQANSDDQIDTIYGSSGKFFTQIQQGAPYDMYFSADIEYPQLLYKEGFAASDVSPYAVGRIVLWSKEVKNENLTFEELTKPSITKIAIANSKHAPYGKRAEEALRSSGVWDLIKLKIVLGENVAQAAQFVYTGNAQIGIIALSLAKNPNLANQGSYWLIPESMHTPLEQGFIITKRAEGNSLASRFSKYMSSDPARLIMKKYGFMLPGGNDAH